MAVDAERPLSVARALRSYDYAQWDLVRAPIELDVVQMSHGAHPTHVGVWIEADGGLVMHAVRGAGVLCQRLASLRLNGWRLLDIYRRRACVPRS